MLQNPFSLKSAIKADFLTLEPNIQSEITAGNDLILVAGDDANIIGSKIKATDQININVGDDLNIVNAKDSSFSGMETKKKGTVKAKIVDSGSYKETAVKSEIEADQINLSADGDIFVRSSDIKTVGDLNIGTNTLAKDSGGNYITDGSGNYVTQSDNLVNNLTITNDTLNEYSYHNVTKSYTGVAKVASNIASTMVASLDLMMTMTGFSQIDAIDKGWDGLKDNSAYNVKVKENTRADRTTIASSTINAGDNLNIHTNEDTTIKASNLSSGTDAGSTTGAINITADNLNILADQETTLTNHDEKKKRTLSFNDWNDGSFTAGNVVNSGITAKNNDINLSVTNQINTSYDTKIFDSLTGNLNNQNGTVDTSALQYLTQIQNNNNSQTLYNPITQTIQQWGDATRGLTEAGTAVVAIAAVAATILTAGAAGFAVAGTAAAASASATAVGVTTIGVAVVGAAASTASISATNTSMNVDGDMFKQAGDIGEQTAKDTTSKEALKSYAIAGATAALTLGLASGVDTASNAMNVANNSVTTAIKHSLVQSVSSSVAESAINGDSFSETFKESTKNLLINTAGALAANQIGGAAPSIGRPMQLALHGVLGCAMAAAGNNSCSAGATAGVIGEITAGFLNRNTNMTDAQIIESSKLTGALTAAMVAGPDDGGSVFAGSQIARNAAENNELYTNEHIEADKKQAEAMGNGEPINGKVALGIVVAGAALAQPELIPVMLEYLGKNGAVSGVAGASGAAYGVYSNGGSPNQTLIAAGLGFVLSSAPSLALNAFGVTSTITNVTLTSSVSGVIGSAFMTHQNNPNATIPEYLNNGLKSGIGAAAVGVTTAVFTPAGSGMMGQVIGAQTALPIDMFMSVINNKYDIIKTPQPSFSPLPQNVAIQ